MRIWAAALAAVLLTACPGFGDELTSVFTEVPERPTFSEHIAPIMAFYCDECHGAEGSETREPFLSDSYADGAREGVFSKRRDVKLRVIDKDPSPMPPAGERPLSVIDREILEKWLSIGAPER